MNNGKLELIAYLATIVAIVVLVAIGAGLAAIGKYSEAIGVGGAVTGLIGVMRQPHPNTAAASVGPAGAVIVNPPLGE